MADIPKSVSRFEGNLLTILRHLLGGPTAGDALRMIGEKLPRPVCLSPNAVSLVKDTLAKGCVLALVKQGGWRNERILRNGETNGGRAWDRTPLDERSLEFGPDPLEFLIWLTAETPIRPGEPWKPQSSGRTAGDELFFALALSKLKTEDELLLALREKAPFANNALARLVMPRTFDPDLAVPDFTPWCVAPRVAILESLQAWLAKEWIQSERAKGQAGDWTKLGRQGRAEEAVLDAYLAAARSAGRPDLGRFLLTAATGVFANSDRTADYWMGGLEGPGPARLAERVAIRRAAVCVPRAVGTLADWTNSYRTVGYFDDGYTAAQLWKSEWDAVNGDELAERAQRVVEAVEPM